MYTRCPTCSTCFRVTERHIAIANGKVRCGKCKLVFNAPEHAVDDLPLNPLSSETNNKVADTQANADKTKIKQTPPSKPVKKVAPALVAPTAKEKIQTNVNRTAVTEKATPSITQSTTSNADMDISAVEKEQIKEEEKIIDKSDIAEFADNPLLFPENHDLFKDSIETTTNEEAKTVEDSENHTANINKSDPSHDKVEQTVTHNNDDEIEPSEENDKDTANLHIESSGQDKAEQTYANIIDEEIQTSEINEEDTANVDEKNSDKDKTEQIDADNDDEEIKTSKVNEEDTANVNKKISDKDKAEQTVTHNDETDDENHFDSAPIQIRNDLKHFYTSSQRNRHPILAFIFIIVLLVLLFSQLVLFRAHDLVNKVPASRPLIEAFCETIKCQYSGPRDTQQIHLISRDVRLHPKEKKALLISAAMINEADFAQPYPKIHIRLSDISDNVIAERIFNANTYLGKINRPFLLMKSKIPIHINFEVVDPGTDAVNFEFTFL